MSAPLSDELQMWGFEEDFILFSDGSLGFALEAVPVDVSCWDDERIDALATKLSQFLNALTPGVDIQFLQEIEAGNGALIAQNEKLAERGLDRTISLLHQVRLEKLKSDDESGSTPRHGLKIFVRKSPPAALLPKPRLFSRTMSFAKIGEENLGRELNAMHQLREDLLHSLASLDLSPRALEERTIAREIYRQWNPTRPVTLGSYDPEDIRSSLLFTDIGIEPAGFSFGGLHYRIVSLKLLPEQTYASMARVLTELPFDSRLFLSIHVPDQTKELETLQLQRRLAFSMARGKQSGVTDIESEAKLEDLETLISQMVAQGEKVFHMSLNVVLRGTNENEIHEQLALTLMKLRDLAGAEGMEESLAAFDIFAELAEPNARARERAKRVKTSTLADLLPIYGPWAGHETPRILLKSLQGSLVSFDPFSNELSNYNQIVTGGSGSGKSFLTNILLLQMLKEKPRVFVIDIGGSYRKLCDNLSGQYIPIQLNSNDAINPFDLLAGEEKPSSHKVKFLVGLIEMMTREEGDSRIGRLERAEIEEVVEDVYRAKKVPYVSDLRQRLLDHPDEQMKRFGKILTPWCGDSPYGRFVDRPTTLQLTRPLVSFDLKGLETYPDLQAVCLYIITDYVWREVQRDRGTMKFLIFDECWKLLESDAGSAFIGEVFRTFRKYYASAIAISQNIDDFARSRVANAVLPNTSIKWVLMQKGADQARLKGVLQLNDSEMALIGSLRQERGLYSQAFLMAEDKHAVVEIEPTALEYWIATTDPRDLAAFDELMRTSPERSQLDILQKLAEKLPRGVSASKEGK